MSADVSKFMLAGARFNKLIVDESSLGDPDNGELEVRVSRVVEGISSHQLEDRPVIEIMVGIVIVATDQSQPLVDIKCTAGFVGVDPTYDGNLDEFEQCRDYYARAVYWIIRSRLQTLAATTRLQLSGLPWDIHPDYEVKGAKPSPGKAAKKSSVNTTRSSKGSGKTSAAKRAVTTGKASKPNRLR